MLKSQSISLEGVKYMLQIIYKLSQFNKFLTPYFTVVTTKFMNCITTN